ncbi:melanocortin receptor 5-like [Actinia tenebrosa]|uniref:Melanocortin receptor 5-like n=1 Tax=Actinia tenebrosa TaxID=6105 RepID=A0A6P8HA31_ACTTE|nr:melanocortin receptor 5-like [Actinia tenebrosa]
MDMKKSNGTISNERLCSTIEYCTDTDNSFHIANVAINIFFCVPTVVINLILFVAVCRTSTLRTPSNILICALASTDLFVGLTTQPLYAVLLYSMTTNLPLSIKCVLQTMSHILGNVFVGMSFLTFTAISVDKLLMVHFHLRYNTVVTNKRITFCVLVFLAICAVLAVSNIFTMRDYTIKVTTLTTICFIVAFISYSKIYRTVIRHQKEIHDQTMAVATRGGNNKVLELARFKKRTFSMMCIYAIFLLFYLPYICSIVLIQILEHCLILEIKIFSGTLIFVNSLVNPVIICWKMREIRNAMKELVCFMCSKQN